MYAVVYPACCRTPGKLRRPDGNSVKLFVTPCLCAYTPLRSEARLGEHSEVVLNALRKLTPSLAMLSMCGVLRCGCPAYPTASHRRSSRSTNRIFGCVEAA